MALTEWSAFITAAPDKGLQVAPELLVVKGVGTNNLYLLEADPATGAIEVSGTNFSGTFSPTGLKNGGRVTEVVINAVTWTQLPAVALTMRNALAIQNYSGQEIKVNYSASVVGYVGVIISDQNERFYDITDAIPIFAKSSSSTVTIIVEEIS